MAEAIVSMVVGRLTDLLNEEAHLLHGVSDEIQQVVTKLTWIKTFLHNADSRIDEHRVRLLLAEVRDLVYDAENVVERYLLKASSSQRHRTHGGLKNKVKRGVCVSDAYGYHHKFSNGIKHLITKMENLFNCFRDYKIISTLEAGQVSSSSEISQGKLKRFYSYTVVEPDLFVGFQKNVVSLVQHLLNDSDDCYRVVFIWGMGGLGKTTLANKIYNDLSVKSHFERLAWVTISQKWQPEAVLQRIFISLVPKRKEEILKWGMEKLVENLLEIQQQKKCLIVLDDIWTNDAWDSIRAAFPTETSGSKLLLTSRNEDLAAHVNTKCLIHKPKLLNADQSWELLFSKALPNSDHIARRDLKEMEKWGREMVRSCAGLPLAIMVLGGVLVTKPTFIEWQKVYHDSLYSLKRGKGFGEGYQKEVFHILFWSYNALPAQLKLCFLYLGKFKEDEEIDAETLYQLWIAEGMVLSSDRSGEETMMEVAESYMGELVHKSMVQVKFGDATDLLRKFKSCRLHDIMRDLSLHIAEREDFFNVINLQKVNDVHYDSLVELASTRQVVVYSCAREFTSVKDNRIQVNKASKRRLRSLMYFHDKSPFTMRVPRHSEKLTWNFAHSRFLRIFVLEGTMFTGVNGCLFYANPGNALGSLVNLRYLSLKTPILFFPSIQNLELLQTLKLQVSGDYDWACVAPWTSSNVLKKLGRLQHLYLPLRLSEGPTERKLRFDGLSKLETLENFNTSSCEVKDLAKLTNLRKLTVRVLYSHEDVKEMMKYFQAIASSSGSSTPRLLNVFLDISYCDLQDDAHTLRQLLSSPNLYSLSIEGKIPELVLHNHIDRLSSSRITILTLSQSELDDDPMPVLEKLPVLSKLILKGAFKGDKMVCTSRGFLQLTHLEMCNLYSLKEWRVEEGSIPNLSYLKLSRLSSLVEFPKGLKFLKHLRQVDLLYMYHNFWKMDGAAVFMDWSRPNPNRTNWTMSLWAINSVSKNPI